MKLTRLVLLTIVAMVINSCKRDSKSNTPAAGEIAQAKAWYESFYPSSVISNSSLVTMVQVTAG